MRCFCILVLSLLALSCAHKTSKNIIDSKENSEKIIVHPEYIGEEPTEPEATEFYEPVPPIVDPIGQNGIPSDATILFDGSGLEKWASTDKGSAAGWHLNEDGSMTVKDLAGDIQTKQKFGDVQLHIEWKSPEEVQREGQNRGNSGIFLSSHYEVQVLDNNDNDTYVNGQVGSIYKQHVPLAKASVPTGQWNSYDVIYHPPKFNNSGQKIKSGTITVLHNGVLIQDHVEIKGTTPYIGWPKNAPHGKGPLRLQDHKDNSRVSYRNIWIREL